jgi:hypothetical protein
VDAVFILPLALNARSQASGTYCDDGKMSLSMYMFSGDISSDAGEESKDVHCFIASLSEHDFESVGGLSIRA